jgi:hypothetical protein
MPASASAWEPVLTGAAAASALALADDVGGRLRGHGAVDDAVEAARRPADEPRLVHWRPEGLWQGYAGLALLPAALDAVRPGHDWDRTGLEHLRVAVRGIESRRDLGPGLAHGLSGLATAAHALSREGTRYRRLLCTVEAALVEVVTAHADTLRLSGPHGVAVSTFDVIAGLTGAGRYLLARRDELPCRRALESVLSCLVCLSEEDAEGVPHWHTGLEHMTDGAVGMSYPDGHVNLGLAHGVAGPLALLSLATIAGVAVDGQRQAIVRTADWLGRSRLDDEWGVNFPPAAPLAPPGGTTAHVQRSPSRSTWCYGAPGMARALWLAGTATHRRDCRDLAVAAMGAVYRRPASVRRVDSPTVCHGVAGLLQVTLRFANECRSPMFVDAARDLTARLVDAHEPASRFGYRNLESNGGRVDHPGLLDGAAGVALVLLAAATPVEPTWDRVLLLS